MIEKNINRINQKIGEAIYLSALKEIASGQTGLPRPGAFLWVLSALIVASPFVFALLGVALILADFPNLVTLIFGVVFICAGWMLRPRRHTVPDRALDRDQLPETFALLDAVAEHMQAPKVSKVVLESDFDAFATQTRQDNVIGIGAPLWLLADRPQRLALLAHAMGHLVNQDARRGSLPALALQVLEGWHSLVAEDYYVDEYSQTVERENHGLLADVWMGSMQFCVELVTWVILKQLFASTQKEEYKADALAAKVAGPEAKTGILDLLVQIEASSARRSGILPRPGESGFDFLTRIAETPRQLPEEAAARAMAQHREEKLSLDRTHPPTIYRSAFINGLPPALLGDPLQVGNWDSVEAELKTQFERIGQREMQKYELQ